MKKCVFRIGFLPFLQDIFELSIVSSNLGGYSPQELFGDLVFLSLTFSAS